MYIGYEHKLRNELLFETSFLLLYILLSSFNSIWVLLIHSDPRFADLLICSVPGFVEAVCIDKLNPGSPGATYVSSESHLKKLAWFNGGLV